MNRTETGTGRTIDQAVDSALNKLGASRSDDFEVEVLQQPESGIFGLFGKKDAIVQVKIREQVQEPQEKTMPIFSVKEEEEVQEETEQPEEVVEEVTEELEPIALSKEEQAVNFLEELFDAMGIDCEIEAELDEDFLRINLIGDKMGIIIGRRGQTLDSIQYLTSLVVNKEGDDYTRIIIDTENYRDKRQQTLENLADKMAGKAIRYKRRVTLEPMNPAERRIIHARLQNNKNVETYSVGSDPYRHVVIQSKYSRR